MNNDYDNYNFLCHKISEEINRVTIDYSNAFDVAFKLKNDSREKIQKEILSIRDEKVRQLISIKNWLRELIQYKYKDSDNIGLKEFWGGKV